MTEPSYRPVSTLLRPEGTGALTVRTLQRSSLAMVVIRYGGAGSEQASDSLIPEDAHTFGWHHRGATGTHCVSSDPKVKSPLNNGHTNFCFLPELDFLRLTTPCVAQHFVITRAFLDELAEDLEARPISRIGKPDLAVDDPLLASFGSRLLDYVESPEELDILSADQVMMSLAVYVCGRYGGLVTRRPFKGGLTRWQVRLAQDMIDANLLTGVPLKALAQACGLQTSQFAHAFKRSVGVAPRQWLISRRLDRARSLLRDGNIQLADVALTCGFADQSHFTRTFRRHEDGILDLPLAMPKELGGKGGATNPEQLFAGGYAACFENAVIHVTRAQADKVRDDDIEVVCEVSLLPNGEGGFKLAVSLEVEIAGIDQAKAEEIVKAAHAVCPYSNAIRGNVDVDLKVFTN